MTDVAAVAGTSIVEARRVLAEIVGADVFDRAVGALPRETREAYVHATPVSWVPVSVITDVLDACARATGREPRELNRATTRAATQRQFRGVWKVFFRFTSDVALLSRGPVMYGKTYNRGRMVIETLHAGRLAFDVLDYPDVSELVVLDSLALATEEVLRVAGRTSPTVTCTPRPGGGRFEGTWAR